MPATDSIHSLDTPALLVDASRLEQNIRRMAAVAAGGGKLLRPHAKTHKCPEIAKLQIDAGACGLTVAKLGEAEAFAAAGATDLFVANQVVGPAKVARALALALGCALAVGVDSIECAAPLALAAQARGMRLAVRIEVDTGGGRAGVRSLEEAVALAAWIAESGGLTLDGIYTHEGQLYKLPGMQERSDEARRVSARMGGIRRAIQLRAPGADAVSVGSTPGARLMAASPEVTEIRPGNYVFCDRTQLDLGASEEQCALHVITTVTSVRPDGVVIVDAGTKTLAADRPFADSSMGLVVGRPNLFFATANEEHGILRRVAADPVRVGDRLLIVPNHACACVNLHDWLHVHDGERLVDRWPVSARGRVL